MADDFHIRNFSRNDTKALIGLMKGLAELEGYLHEFAVYEDDLINRGLQDKPEFFACVAEDKNGALVGMAVYYFVPYTYDLCPDMVLKELFVAPRARGVGIGQALMARLYYEAAEKGCKRIKWLVLSENEPAKKFYSGLGARQDRKWENWYLYVQPKQSDTQYPSTKVS